MKLLWYSLGIFGWCTAALFAEKPVFTLNEIGVGSGFASGSLRKQPERYEAVPIFVHLGFELNRAFGFPSHRGSLNFVLEPFYNPIVSPEDRQETGLEVMFQYVFPPLGKIAPYLEAGAGPMYLGLETKAQGPPGFNFLDQLGAGVKWFTQTNQSLNVGYRYRHISHASLRSSPNKGIDTHAVVASYSFYR